MGLRHRGLRFDDPPDVLLDLNLTPSQVTPLKRYHYRQSCLASISFHAQREREARELMLRTIVTAHDVWGATFQLIADELGCSKHWAYKLYQKGKQL